MAESPWLTIEQASAYLGMGRTVIYTLAREGRIPANKVGKKWMFQRAQLDAWVRSNQPVSSFFTSSDFSIEGNPNLREPQLEAYNETFRFFRAGKNKAILQIPVGCGKTGLASILPFGIANGRVLIIAPNLQIKNGLYEAMDVTNRPKCFWRKARVLTDETMASGPLASTLDSGNITVATKSHIVITNVQQLATNVEKWLHQFDHEFFDMIIVDEAHHSAADSWKRVVDHFPAAKIIHLTATPFRSDRQEIDGELIYRYSFRSATLKGYIKRLKASYVAPSQIELGFTDEGGKVYTLDEVMQLKEEDWFSRGVALAPLCNKHIVDASLAKLEELRQSGTRHQLIAVACSINHARDVRSLYEERGYTAEIIHSKQQPDEQEKVLGALRNGTLDCIVQVSMLGEGFDHPKLSVAAIFRPFRTLAPYIQFVGRIMRVIVQNDPIHPDNLGHIVTHLGMNLDRRLSEFKQFENDDEAFWERVIGGEEPETPAGVQEGDTRLRAGETSVVVSGEIVDSLWEEDFTSLEDQHIIAELRERMTLLGLDATEVEQIVRRAKPGAIARTAAAPSFPVQPQRQLQEIRKRVYEQGPRLAKILLNHAGLKITGRDLITTYKSLKLTGKNNLIAAITMVNQEISKRLGKDRDACSTEDFEAIMTGLDDILQTLVRRVKKAQSEYERSEA